MEELATPRILISGTGDGVGKSLISIGLTYELRRRGIGVSCVVLGSRLAQATLLKRIAGRSVRCLDERVLSPAQTLVSLQQAGVGADLVIIEGRRGLFDGTLIGSFRGSDAEFAALTRTPAAVVVDARGYGQSVAALVRGFAEVAGSSRSEGGFDVAGAILNRIGAEQSRDAAYYEEAFAALAPGKLLATLPDFPHEAIFPREEISQEKNEALIPRQFLIELGKIVAEHVDIERVIEAAEQAPAVELPDESYPPMRRRCRIAVTDDSCFSVGFQDNLEWLKVFGAEIVPFSPVADQELPRRIGGIYITGGYLREYARDLVRNTGMVQSIYEFYERGGVIYSEGSGTAYLASEFGLGEDKKVLEGVGILPFEAIPQEAPVATTQESITVEESVLGRPGLIVHGVNSGEWKAAKDDRVLKALRMARGENKAPVLDGYSPGAQVLSTFSFFHFGSNPTLAKNLADAAEVVEPLGGGQED